MPNSTRVALVTGSARGLGATISEQLAREGAHAVVNYATRADAAEALVRRIHDAGGSATAIQADIGDPEANRAMFERIARDLGRLDILVNNAGINRDGPFLRMTLDQWDAVHRVHLRGAFVACQHAARMMLAGEGGVIVNIGATTGVRGRANGANFCAAKAGLMVLTRCLARELAPGIRVNTVVPGLIPTDETTERYHLDDPAAVERHVAQTPAGRLGTPEDVAQTVSFLCSPAAAMITGQTLYVTGGAHMGI